MKPLANTFDIHVQTINSQTQGNSEVSIGIPPYLNRELNQLEYCSAD